MKRGAGHVRKEDTSHCQTEKGHINLISFAPDKTEPTCLTSF